MSHYSRVKTQFRHREALIACLKNLGYNVETDTVIQGHHGEHTVDIAVRKAKGYGVGFVKSPDGTYDMVADWWGVAGSDERNITRELVQQADAIQKEYAKKMVLEQAALDGFEIVSETEEQDGTLRIVVRRWE
jgi:alanine racemase